MDKLVKVEMARYRAGIYGTVSRLFLNAPSALELQQLVSLGRAIMPESCVRASEFELMRSVSRLDDKDIGALRTRVASEYAELFVGPRPPLASLYESLYVGSNRHLLSETTEVVRRYYEAFGLSVRKRNRVPDDHLGYELEFLGILCEREASAWSAGTFSKARQLQHAEGRFIEEHPLCWIHQLSQRIEKAPRSEFYALLIRFTSAFLCEDEVYPLEAPPERIAS